jgi:hypothetical protein
MYLCRIQCDCWICVVSVNVCVCVIVITYIWGVVLYEDVFFCEWIRQTLISYSLVKQSHK